NDRISIYNPNNHEYIVKNKEVIYTDWTSPELRKIDGLTFINNKTIAFNTKEIYRETQEQTYVKLAVYVMDIDTFKANKIKDNIYPDNNYILIEPILSIDCLLISYT